MRVPAGLLALVLMAAPTSAGAQTSEVVPTLAHERVARLVEEGEAAHSALRPLDALHCLERAMAVVPDDYEALWRAAREAVNLGMLAASDDDSRRWYATAEGYARRAREANPDGPRGGEWLAITLGREALEQGRRARVRAAVEIRAVALETLALDSTNAGAHHVLGEWNAEVRRLSGIERWVARTLMGASVFDQASWEEAEKHLQRAIELDPAGLIHYLALARVYLDRGRDEDARRALRAVLERPAMEPIDPLNKQAAQELLSGH